MISTGTLSYCKLLLFVSHAYNILLHRHSPLTVNVASLGCDYVHLMLIFKQNVAVLFVHLLKVAYQENMVRLRHEILPDWARGRVTISTVSPSGGIRIVIFGTRYSYLITRPHEGPTENK